jgi:hypothetical protein
MKKCQDLLPLPERMEASNFRNIVTGNESWFTFELQQSTKWSTSHEDVPQRVRQQIGAREFMLTVIWGVDGFPVVDLMTSQPTFDSQYFLDNNIVPLVEKVFPKGSIRMLVGDNFTWMIAASTFQGSLSNLSSKIISRVFRNQYTVPFLHPWTSGLLVI